MIYARQSDGRVLVDLDLLAAATSRTPATIRARCTASPDGLYDLDDARNALADVEAPPDGPAVTLTAAEAWRWLGVPAGTVRSWAARLDILPAGWRGASPTYRLAHLVELASARDARRAATRATA